METPEHLPYIGQQGAGDDAYVNKFPCGTEEGTVDVELSAPIQISDIGSVCAKVSAAVEAGDGAPVTEADTDAPVLGLVVAGGLVAAGVLGVANRVRRRNFHQRVQERS